MATLVFVGSLSFIGYSRLFLSPDETANALFASQFMETGTLQISSPENLQFHDQLFPRSMVARNGVLIPGSFLGLPVVYGSLGALFGPWLISILTPLLAFLAVGAFFGIMKRLFNEHVAFLSSLLLAFHPAWWYYASRNFMHNVPFLAFLLFAAYTAIVRPIRTGAKASWVRSRANLILSGGLCGIALAFRTSAIVWLIGTALLLLVIVRPRIRWPSVTVFFASVALVMMPVAFLNDATYGGAFQTGYTVESGLEAVRVAVPESLESPSARERIEQTLSPLFPFGIHPRAALHHLNLYGFGLFWWMSILTLLGLPLLFAGEPDAHARERRKIYLTLFLLLSLWLTIQYGSWVIHDNPDPSAVTLGNSYIRYWLPLFVLSLPFAGLAIDWIAKHARTRVGYWLIASVLLTWSFGLSVQQVFFTKGDGLVDAGETLLQSEYIRMDVLSRTEENAVIVTDRGDKIFFPYRAIRQPLRDEQTYRLIPELVANVPVYYYGLTLPEEDLAYLNAQRFAPEGLSITLIKTYEAESLYKVAPLPL